MITIVCPKCEALVELRSDATEMPAHPIRQPERRGVPYLVDPAPGCYPHVGNSPMAIVEFAKLCRLSGATITLTMPKGKP